jgi:hypothetical protein
LREKKGVLVSKRGSSVRTYYLLLLKTIEWENRRAGK